MNPVWSNWKSEIQEGKEQDELAGALDCVGTVSPAVAAAACSLGGGQEVQSLDALSRGLRCHTLPATAHLLDWHRARARPLRLLPCVPCGRGSGVWRDPGPAVRLGAALRCPVLQGACRGRMAGHLRLRGGRGGRGGVRQRWAHLP